MEPGHHNFLRSKLLIVYRWHFVTSNEVCSTVCNTVHYATLFWRKSVVGYKNSIILHIHKVEFYTCLRLLLYSYVWYRLPVLLSCDLNCKHLWLNEASINGVVFFPPSLSARTSMLQLNNLANQHELQLLWVFLFCFCLLLFIALCFYFFFDP